MSTAAFALESADDRTGARYAGFGLRLAAGLIDLAVFVPLVALGFWAMDVGPGAFIAFSLFHDLAYFAYTIVGHAQWGQTVGKRVVGIRVLDVTGGRIGWRQALRRSSVDIVLGLLTQMTYWITIAGIPAAELATQPWPDVHERYSALRPWWVVTVEYAYFAWIGSEVVSVLFNRRRRALHDFIAGTVVVSERHDGLPPADPPLRGWRGALATIDTVLMGVGAVLTVLTAVGSFLPDVSADQQARRVFLAFALFGALLAGSSWAAGRALRAHWRSHWVLHAFVLLLILAALSPLLLR